MKNIPPALLPGMVLMTALLGSPHCLVMCGPICFGATGGQRKPLTLYHVGRGVSYLLLGATAGYFGELMIGNIQNSLMSIVAPVAAFLLVLFGISLISKSFQSPRLPDRFVSRISNWTYRVTNNSMSLRSFTFGMLSGILPCGFLYLFVVAAAATQHIWTGALVLFFFWMGTVPALSAAHFYIQKYLAKYRTQMAVSSRLILATIFILVGGQVLYHRYSALNQMNHSHLENLSSAGQLMFCLPNKVSKH